jgi:membrane protein
MASIRAIFGTSIWEMEHPLQKGAIGSKFLHLIRVFSYAWKSFGADELLIRATALAYTTILTIVPLLAVAFSVYAAFPGLNDAYLELRAVIYEYLAAGASESVIESLDRFIANAHSGSIAGVGTAMLFLAVLFLMGAIEYSFNTIWSVRHSRKLIDRIVYYIAIIMVGPLLIGISLRTFVKSIIAEFGVLGFVERSLPAELWTTSVSLLSSITAITVLYVVIPNTKVYWRAALAGGVLAGLLFEVAKSAYGFYVTNVINYSAIYGAVGAIPVFIIWIYLIWLVVLFGGEFAYAWQNVDTHHLKLAHRDTSQSYQEWLAVSIMVEVTRRFGRDDEGPTLEELATSLRIPHELTESVVDKMATAGLITDSNRGHLPGRDPQLITLADVLGTLRSGSCEEDKFRNLGDPKITEVLEQFESTERERYELVTLSELAAHETNVDKTE